MRVWQICVLVFYLLISNSTYALNCRSDRGAKEDEFRRVYNNCVKQVERNSSRHPSEDWKDRNYNQRNQRDRDNNNENWNSKNGNRDNDYEDRNRDMDHRDDGKERYDKRQNRENGNENGAKRMSDRYDRTNGKRSRMNMNENNSGSGRSRDGVMFNYGRNDQISGRDEFFQTEDMNSDSTGVQYYYPSTQSSRRYKREKRVEINSGQRSQYNPHSQKSNSHDNNYNKMNSSDNSSKEMDKACIFHCFLENLHMTDDRGMPDRYLVTHAFIRDEKNEDLQDFIQETIEECFQILDNENTEDKCQFSKDLLTCLTEKGRANCDNWSEKTSYLFE
ncbi:unnamed protein product [Euphydryas editha]|nr:unnamed protein product [Euphydryas editha]